jgi:hypothetical protein
MYAHGLRKLGSSQPQALLFGFRQLAIEQNIGNGIHENVPTSPTGLVQTSSDKAPTLSSMIERLARET